MRNKGINIAEILESVDSIVSDKGYKNYNKGKIIDTNKQFVNKKIDMTFNRDAEKSRIIYSIGSAAMRLFFSAIMSSKIPRKGILIVTHPLL